MIYVSHDSQNLNFICGKEDSRFVSFDPEWKPLQIRDLFEDLKPDSSASVEIYQRVITNRDKVDLRKLIAYIRKKDKTKTLEGAVERPPVDIDFLLPVTTKYGRVVK